MLPPQINLLDTKKSTNKKMNVNSCAKPQIELRVYGLQKTTKLDTFHMFGRVLKQRDLRWRNRCLVWLLLEVPGTSQIADPQKYVF